MRFNVKMTAAAALVFAAALIWTPPSAHALEQPAAASSAGQTAPTPAPEQKAPVIVTVQSGDSLSLIADNHLTTWVRLYDANPNIADPNLINPGEQITIPDPAAELPDRYGELTAAQRQTMPAVAVTEAPAKTVSAAPTPAPRARTTVATGNAYVWGQCTWYVKNRRPDIGSYWGNAGYAWIGEAQATGFSTGSAPQAGAVAVEPGHVAYVESASGGMVTVSEMNWNGGVGIVSYRTVPASTFAYIY